MNILTSNAHFRQRVIKKSYKIGVTAASKYYRISRQAIYEWRAKYDGRSWKSLIDKSHRPHHHPNEHTPEDKEFFRCSAYKDNTGSCTIHFIRNVVLEEIVLETIQKVAEYISQFEPVFLYLFAKKHKLTKAKDLKNAKFKLEQSKARVDEIDRVLTKLYEDNALGKITDERFKRLSATYEKEQRELADCIIKSKTEITAAEQDNVDLKHF